jgi:anti-anti-sigma factor
MDMSVESARIEVQSDDGVSVISLIGEFDLATNDLLQQQFRALRDANCRRVVLDLSQTQFLDSTMLGALVRAHRDGLRITIRGASGIAQKALEVSGLATAFHSE